MFGFGNNNMSIHSLSITFMFYLDDFAVSMDYLAFPTVKCGGKLHFFLSLILHKGIDLAMKLSLTDSILNLPLFLEFGSPLFGLFNSTFKILLLRLLKFLNFFFRLFRLLEFLFFRLLLLFLIYFCVCFLHNFRLTYTSPSIISIHDPDIRVTLVVKSSSNHASLVLEILDESF
jgi:hypothetical protein